MEKDREEGKRKDDIRKGKEGGGIAKKMKGKKGVDKERKK